MSEYCGICHGTGLEAAPGDDAWVCGTCGGTGQQVPETPTLEERLAALEAEHAKDRARIEKLERLLAYTAREVDGILPFSFQPWARALWHAMHDELTEIDRDQKEGG